MSLLSLRFQGYSALVLNASLLSRRKLAASENKLIKSSAQPLQTKHPKKKKLSSKQLPLRPLPLTSIIPSLPTMTYKPCRSGSHVMRTVAKFRCGNRTTRIQSYGALANLNPPSESSTRWPRLKFSRELSPSTFQSATKRKLIRFTSMIPSVTTSCGRVTIHFGSYSSTIQSRSTSTTRTTTAPGLCTRRTQTLAARVSLKSASPCVSQEGTKSMSGPSLKSQTATT